MPELLSSVLLAISKIPLLLRTIVYYGLGLSPTARKWDFRTEVAVTMFRDFLANSPPSTVTQQQALFMHDPGVQGGMWVSKVTMPAPPEDDARQRVFAAIRALGTGREEYAKPSLEAVGGEWVGYRGGVSNWAREPKGMSEKEKYDSIVKEAKNSNTVLYIHGGASYLMDPVSTRPVASAYANYSGSRVFSVRYRLAPQGPFPSALIDVFVAYLSLLYPPPGSFHEAASASSLIVTGDSAGGNISSSLLQLLLQLHRDTPGKTPTVLFHGAEVEVPLPAGVGLNSPSFDITGSMQWSETYLDYDYLPPPKRSPVTSPPCAAWPTNPPRVSLYCEGNMLAHPLVSPMAAASWEGAPPVFVVCGEERLAEEDRTVASKMARQGVPVVWEQYEAMPHCFSLLLTWTAASRASYEGWAAFVRDAVRGEVETKGCYISVKSLARKEVDVETLTSVGEEEVLENMEAARKRIEERFGYLLK